MSTFSRVQSFLQTPQEINRSRRLFITLLINAAICLVLAATSNANRTFQQTADYFVVVISAVPVMALVASAFIARSGRFNIPILINTAILLTFFTVGAFTQADIGSWYAILAFGMTTTVLIQVYNYNEARTTYAIVLIVSITMLVGDLFLTTNRLPVTDLHRTLAIIAAVASSGYLIFSLFEQFSGFSLQVKFIISVLILAVFSIAITIIFVSFTIRRSTLNNVVQNLQTVAEAGGVAVGEFLAREIRVLETLSSNRAIQLSLERANEEFDGLSEVEIQQELLDREFDWERANKDTRILLTDIQTNLNLNEFSKFSGQKLGLLITNRYGGLLATTGNPEQFYYGDESWYFRAFAGGFGSQYISDPYELQRSVFDPNEELEVFDTEPVVLGVDIAVPIYAFEDNSTIPTVLGVAKETVVINDLLKELNRGFSETDFQEIDLIIGDTEYGFRDNTILINQTNVTQQIADDFQAQGYSLAEYQGDISYVVGSSIRSTTTIPTINNLEWRIVTHQSSVEALGIVTAQQRTQLLVGLGILLVAGLAAAAVGQLVSSPILRLSEITEKVSQGERDIRAEIETGDEIATLAQSFNQMITQIETNERELEKRVADRTRALETSARISRSLTTIIDRNELILAIVQEIKEAFDYYHVHIYLLSEDEETLEIVGGSGEVGQVLLERGHNLPINAGLVGQAALSKRPVWAPDVSEYPAWKPNDLLPDTKAEVAVPIIINERVLGVIDVQNSRVDSLTLEDVEALQSLGYQIAIAIRNSELYTQLQQDANREQLLNQINQKIQGTTDIESAMKVAVRELGTVLGNVQTSVALYQNEKNGHD